MSELVLIKEKTCAVTGHRDLPFSFDKNNLKDKFLKLTEKGIDTFLIGMAVGFDTLCFKVLREIRREKNIRIVACIPCINQSERFSYKDKKIYDELLEDADKKILISKEYTPYCMQKRNMFMVDNSLFLVCYIRKEKGGTANTLNYAEKKGNIIIYV